jgi:hypothetical protein
VLNDQWDSGFIVDVYLTDTGRQPFAPWTLRFAFPGSQRLLSSWSGITAGQDGHTVIVSGTELAAGATVHFDLQGTWSGSNPRPTSFAVNGATCG